MVYYIVLFLLASFHSIFLCPCMAVNVSVQYNGGLLPDIIILLPKVISIGEPVNMP